jgi:hypothetical protein
MVKTESFLGRIAILSLAAFIFGQTGCASSGDRYRTAGQYEQDQHVAAQVREALNTAPVYKYPDVKVSPSSRCPARKPS